MPSSASPLSTTGISETTQRASVPADKRLIAWAPAHPASSTLLPPRLEARIQEIITAAYRPSTLKSYGSGLASFLRFCDENGIPEHHRIPCSQDTLAGFIVSLTGTFSGSAISGYVAGVRAWHIIHRHQWAVDQTELQALLKGAENLAPESSKRPARQPFTPDLIICLRNAMDLSSPLDAAVFACLTTCFYTCARLGEFTVPNLASFQVSRHITPAGVQVKEDREGRTVHAFFLPCTKSSPTGEEVFWAHQDGLSDPLWAWQNHCTVNEPPQNTHLFSYRYGAGHRPLTKSAFLKRISAVTRTLGLLPLQGHSLRIGGTLEYLLRGVPFDVVKSIGRWASDAFTRYLREHAQVLAPYLQANRAVHDEFVRLTMPPPR